MERISKIQRNFNFKNKFNIFMTVSDICWGGMDFEFYIKGDVLPMVKIGKKPHYSDSDNPDSATDVYTPAIYGRVCQYEQDVNPSKIELFESSEDGGILCLEDDKYTMLCVDKEKFTKCLYDLASDIKKEIIRTIDITDSNIESISSKLVNNTGSHPLSISIPDRDNHSNIDIGSRWDGTFLIGNILVTDEMNTYGIQKEIKKLLAV